MLVKYKGYLKRKCTNCGETKQQDYYKSAISDTCEECEDKQCDEATTQSTPNHR